MVTEQKRSYRRRSDDEVLAELEAKIAEQKNKLERKKQQEREKRALSPEIKEIPRIKQRLNSYAQTALDHGRQDIANSVSMFLAGLTRIYDEEMARTRPEEFELVDAKDLDEDDQLYNSNL